MATVVQAAGLVVGAQTTAINRAGQTVATGTVALSNGCGEENGGRIVVQVHL